MRKHLKNSKYTIDELKSIVPDYIKIPDHCRKCGLPKLVNKYKDEVLYRFLNHIENIAEPPPIKPLKRSESFKIDEWGRVITKSLKVEDKNKKQQNEKT